MGTGPGQGSNKRETPVDILNDGNGSGEAVDMRYTIDDFWIPVLKSNTKPAHSAALVQGWSFQEEGLPTFKEAPLALDPKITDVSDPEDADPKDAQILLVSAPGAVGKTTLAKQIAYETHSIYVDLSAAEPVGGSTLSGSLYDSGLSDHAVQPNSNVDRRT